MKKIFLLVAVVFTTVFTQAVAARNNGDVKVDNIVLQSFGKDFILTSEATWHKIEDVFVVDFKQSGASYTAYYTEDGMLTSISSNIEKEKLPEEVIKRISKKYSNAEIIRALKVRSLPNGISYVIHLNVRGTEKIVKTDTDGSIEKVKTIK